MHHCLQVDEILVRLCSGLRGDKPSLVNMALACRIFYEPALDQCWYELGSLSPLLGCLPDDIRRTESRDALESELRGMDHVTVVTWSLSRAPRPYELHRFNHCASRVRSLTIQQIYPYWRPEGDDMIYIHSSCLSFLLASFGSRPALPNLRSVNYNAQRSDACALSLFLPRSLHSINFMLQPMHKKASASLAAQRTIPLGSVAKVLRDRSPGLTSLNALAHSNVATYDILELARLPSLAKFSCRLDRTFDSQPLQALGNCQPVFPALVDFCVLLESSYLTGPMCDLRRIEALTGLLSSMSSSDVKLQRLQLDVPYVGTPTTLHQLCTTVASFWGSLQRCRLDIFSDSFRDEPSRAKPTVGTFSPLFTLKCVESFSVSGYAADCWTDPDVVHITTIWSQLSFLQLSKSYSSATEPFSLGILPIIAANCPKLEYLIIAIHNPGLDTAPSDLRHATLQWLDLSDSPIAGCLREVARFITHLFPNTRSFRFNGEGVEEEWEAAVADARKEESAMLGSQKEDSGSL